MTNTTWISKKRVFTYRIGGHTNSIANEKWEVISIVSCR